MNNKSWMIVNAKDNNTFWSNDTGWCNYYDADTFTTEQKESLNLPMEGEWIHVGYFA